MLVFYDILLMSPPSSFQKKSWKNSTTNHRHSSISLRQKCFSNCWNYSD